MRILFCDDNKIILEQLVKYVADYFKNIGVKMPEFAVYTSGDTLLANEKFADIAFLDVEMPGRSGIYVSAKLKEFNSHIKIFIVTSFPDYLDEAMKHQVFRYLSKPIDKNRLYLNLKDALYQHSMETKKLTVNTADSVITLPSSSIVYIEAEQRKVIVHSLEQRLKSTDTMEYWQNAVAQLPCFYRSHRSYIINMGYISRINRDSVELSYSGKTEAVYLTLRKYTEIKEKYLLYLESVQ